MTDKGNTANDFLLRHYSPEGKELGAFLPRSSFAEVREPWLGIAGGWNMHIAGNRIGMAVGLGEGRKGSRWVEVDLDGKELGRWPIDIDAEVAAFTPRGTIYADAFGGVIMVLDHATGKWAANSSVGGGRLLGADGDSLFNRDNVLSWVPVTR